MYRVECDGCAGDVDDDGFDRDDIDSMRVLRRKKAESKEWRSILAFDSTSEDWKRFVTRAEMGLSSSHCQELRTSVKEPSRRVKRLEAS